jgi:hypothetical protein
LKAVQHFKIASILNSRRAGRKKLRVFLIVNICSHVSFFGLVAFSAHTPLAPQRSARSEGEAMTTVALKALPFHSLASNARECLWLIVLIEGRV